MIKSLPSIDKEASSGGKIDKDKFLKLYKEKIKDYVEQNPEIIHHNFHVIGKS